MVDNNIDQICSCYGKGKFRVTDYGEINNFLKKTLYMIQPLSWAAELSIKDAYNYHLSPSNFLFPAFVQLIVIPQSMLLCWKCSLTHKLTNQLHCMRTEEQQRVFFLGTVRLPNMKNLLPSPNPDPNCCL